MLKRRPSITRANIPARFAVGLDDSCRNGLKLTTTKGKLKFDRKLIKLQGA